MSEQVEWKCPDCGAEYDRCGKGKCNANFLGNCGGFICECEYDTKVGHGESDSDPCHNASCYHCGWGGQFPVPPFDSTKLKGWAKKAWDAGWRPPSGWAP